MKYYFISNYFIQTLYVDELLLDFQSMCYTE